MSQRRREWRAEAMTDECWILGYVTDPDGEQWPWVFDPALIKAAEGIAQQVGQLVVPDHELDGPLPDKFARRINGDCCGFVTRSGTRCAYPADECPHEWHREAPSHAVLQQQRARTIHGDARAQGLCGATTTSGKPCRNPVGHCHWHTEPVEPTPTTPHRGEVDR